MRISDWSSDVCSSDLELNLYLDQLMGQIEPSPSGEIALARPLADPRFEKPLSGLYWQILREPAGKVVRSRSLWDFELQLPPEPVIDDSVHRQDRKSGGWGKSGSVRVDQGGRLI